MHQGFGGDTEREPLHPASYKFLNENKDEQNNNTNRCKDNARGGPASSACWWRRSSSASFFRSSSRTPLCSALWRWAIWRYNARAAWSAPPPTLRRAVKKEHVIAGDVRTAGENHYIFPSQNKQKNIEFSRNFLTDTSFVDIYAKDQSMQTFAKHFIFSLGFNMCCEQWRNWRGGRGRALPSSWT